MRKQETPCCGLLIIVLICMTSYGLGEESDESIDQQCQYKGTDCRTCIQTHPSCSWCGETGEASITGDVKRCKLHSENVKTCLNSTGDLSKQITYPQSHVELLENEPFTEAGSDFFDGSSKGKVLQMRPQNLTVKLRKNEPLKVNVTFKKVIDYPLDIYYVMDLSNSMDDDLDTLKKLGNKLFDDIKLNVTKNVQLGFGSFVDKVMMPYASTVPAQLQNPCINNANKSTCAPPFGFRHQLEITGNATRFVQEISSTQISGNIDVPEGSFDALMQIAVCSHIKWRPEATRVILLTTDASPHLAMDGKLAAILEANDMKCHLEKNANSYLPDAVVYSKSKTMDYPSLGQLKEAFEKNKIHSIYAVTNEVYPLYKQIEQVLNDAYVAELSSDSSNIIPLINQTYSKLKGRLSLISPTPPDGVTIKSRVIQCPHNTDSETNTTSTRLLCEGIEIGDEVVFEFEFLAQECPSESKIDSVTLKSSSLQDEVVINIEYLCECDCQNNGETNSSQCNYYGGLTCGVCSCHSGKEGSLCQCSSTNNGVPVKNSCIRPGSTHGVYCENNGICECGKCDRCVPPYNGTYCECKTTGCPSNSDGVCGGKTKGWCNNCDDDGKCVCLGGYTIKPTDKTCSCHPKLCKASNITCNGKGTCDCDKCVCNDPSIYTGEFCDTCIDPSCTGVDKRCQGDEIRQCATCKSKRDDCSDVCPSNSFIIYTKVDQFPDCNNCKSTWECKECAGHSPTQPQLEPCTDKQDDGCSLEFRIYWLKTSQFQVYVKEQIRDRDCPKPINPMLIVLPVVGGILLLGVIALIAWKIYINRRDRLQYEEFLEEEKKRKWTKGENPLYENVEQKFANPMFDGNE